MKRIAQSILLVFALGSISYWAWDRLANPASTGLATAATSPPATQPPPSTEPMVLVTYFTTDVRCTSCRTIEVLTRETLEQGFASELASGTLRFRTLNLDRPENKHFESDYDLAFKTVVVSRAQSGKSGDWEKLDEVWSLKDDPEAFKAYLEGPIRSRLAALP
ncbi:nitrophenyl compound nitroreductase subunit ArsF family protein [Haloferula rosea]|uniref:Thioredoxin n=1 Tax=Haloferula rosea TaxID=490093 RepID=A0A934RDT8_9BACT|nr:nitrophenyl compound nitroreductase subunit ArsF family protein [Haloferula rosea]MBK1828923.1 hypothetical protein [Haloferula rosea]